MRKVFNFSPGPAMLPEEVLVQIKEELLDWHGTGMSVMELGHRGEEFKQVIDQTERDLREILNIPSNYHVLFLSGGAATQFGSVPLNLMGEGKVADYVDTGIWSQKAIAEAKRFGTVNIAAKSVSKPLVHVPAQAEWTLDPQAAYLHYTPNETIDGVEFSWIPKTGDVPLVADMSSTILSRPLDVSAFGVIYAGAQKNIGQAGITVVIVRDDLLKRAPLAGIPSMYDYRLQVKENSMYNTPPSFSWYVAGLVFAWIKRQGGLKAMGERNKRKAEKLYAYIDGSDFYSNPVQADSRSWMNVPFSLASDDLNDTFLAESKAAGLVNLKGHRIVGGMRASIYNAMPEAGVDALLNFMQDFARKHASVTAKKVGQHV